MHFDDEFYAQYRDGSTDLNGDGTHQLTTGAGPIARTVHGICRFPKDLPAIVYGGAGSGKYAQLGAYQLVHPSTHSFFALDVSGQMMSTTWHYNLAMGRDAYGVNPHGVGLYPEINHALHLFHILKDDEHLFDKCRAIADMALSQSEREGDNAWVGQDAQR